MKAACYYKVEDSSVFEDNIGLEILETSGNANNGVIRTVVQLPGDSDENGWEPDPDCKILTVGLIRDNK